MKARLLPTFHIFTDNGRASFVMLLFNQLNIGRWGDDHSSNIFNSYYRKVSILTYQLTATDSEIGVIC